MIFRGSLAPNAESRELCERVQGTAASAPLTPPPPEFARTGALRAPRSPDSADGSHLSRKER